MHSWVYPDPRPDPLRSDPRFKDLIFALFERHRSTLQTLTEIERRFDLTPSLVWTIYSTDMGKNPLVNPELLPGTLYLLILRTLRSGPLHGYAIAKRIKDASEQGLDIEDGYSRGVSSRAAGGTRGPKRGIEG
jgi:hypothetical protein